MEEHNADVDTPSGASVLTAGKQSSVASCSETQMSKRVVKLSAKALVNRLDRLQSGRKAKLNKASNVRKMIQGLMQNGRKSEVQKALDLIELCDEIRCLHDSIIGLLPREEKEKHGNMILGKNYVQ